jgi:serine/threonine protein phosphatase 1
MSKWRPIPTDCLYVIADIHGASDLLDKILKRILPLRKSDGIQDRIVFTGDYIDRHRNGHMVIDTLVALEKKYKEKVTFLIGNHELLMLQALGWADCAPYTPSSAYDMWIKNGGYYTLIGYIERIGLDVDPMSLNIGRIKDIIPDEHKNFFLTCLDSYYELDDFIFVHGGCDPTKDIATQELHTLVWDRQLRNFVLKALQNGEELLWDKTIVAGHNSNGRGVPIITEKYMMFDCGGPKRLMVVELNSLEAFMAYPDKDRLIKYELEETVKPAGVFRRST